MDTLSPTQPRLTSRWCEFPTTYRHDQVTAILRWVALGESGAVVGACGTGKSNIAGYLANRPDVTCALLPDEPERYCFLHLDINSLPTVTTTNFYRGLLYTLQDAADETPALREPLCQLLDRLPDQADQVALYFTLQKAHELIIRRAGKQIVWLIDRFDEACQHLEVGVLNSLRNLRDRFKDHLSYIVFTRFPLARLRNPREFDEFHGLVAPHTCWVGAMNSQDAQLLAHQIMTRHRITLAAEAIERLMGMTGSWPALLKAGCSALANGSLRTEDTSADWEEQLLTLPNLQRNCQELWDDCLPAEQAILAAVIRRFDATNFDPAAVLYLQQIGLLQQDATGVLQIFSPLFAAFVKQQRRFSGALSLRNGLVNIGADELPIDLTLLEVRLLEYLVKHAGGNCEKNDVIAYVWPDEKQVHGIRDDSLVQLVKRLRQKIEPVDKSWVYIETVYGRGYRLNQPRL